MSTCQHLTDINSKFLIENTFFIKFLLLKEACKKYQFLLINKSTFGLIK